LALDVLKALGAPARGTVLCALAELADPGGRGFRFGSGIHFFQLFLVRTGERVFAYVNACPHVGSPLDFPEHQFLTPDRANIRCANHGAVFRIEDGECIAGPCPGAKLWPVPIEVVDGTIRILAADSKHKEHEDPTKVTKPLT
jgi:nitrite reductase/ring-hydroxylating ferredoxin subunit